MPIVVLDTPVAREVYGEPPSYVAAATSAATAAALDAGCSTLARRRAAQLARAPGVLARYSWDAAADADARRASKGWRRADDAAAVDRHRQLQRRAGISRTACVARRRTPRRRRTRSSSSTTRRPTAASTAVERACPACALIAARRATSGSRPATTSGSAPAAGELVLLLNNDTIVPAGALDRLVGGAATRTRRPRSPGRGSSTATATPSCRSGR